MRKRLLLLATVLLSVGVLSLLLWLRSSRVTLANYERIKPGMTRTEVETLLGGPPGDYATERTVSANRAYEYVVNLPGDKSVRCSDWRTDGTLIRVIWDEKGAAAGTVWEPNPSAGAGPIGNLRWRIERQWRRWFPD